MPISTKVLPRATTWPGPGTAGAGFNVREKIRKRPNHYTVTGPVLLLVCVKSLRFSLRRDRTRRHVERLRVRRGHPFVEVYLLSEAPELRQLYPQRRWIPDD